MGSEGERSVTILCQKVFVSEYQKISQGNPFFTKILVSKKFMDKKWGMKEGGVSRYSVKNVLTQSTEKLHREQFCASPISGV